jgi:hypothetical protein
VQGTERAQNWAETGRNEKGEYEKRVRNIGLLESVGLTENASLVYGKYELPACCKGADWMTAANGGYG